MRKSRYGLSPKQFEAMKLKQDNSCAICKRPFGDKTPHVDHDHISGEVRGLLCHLCNKALGAFKDDPIILERALNYVKKSVKVSSNGDKL